MSDYEIRYLKRDGSTSLVYRPTQCIGDRDARRAVTRTQAFARAEIWRGLERIEIIAFEHAA